MIKRLLQDEKVVSVAGTVVVHAVLVLLFLWIHISFRPVMEEFTEVTLAGGWQAPSVQPQPPISEPATENEQVQEETNRPLPEEIELPERRQLALNEEELLEKVQPEVEKFVNPGNIVKKSSPVSRSMPQVRSGVPTLQRREKAMETGLFRKQLDEKLLKGTQKVPVNVDQQFEIDWEGEIKREIYQRRLPEFPPDVQREATIKIRFTVLPNGLVGSAVLLQKGDTRLENLTLEAFKTWRFNPLPSYVEQVPQVGIITFHFKLK